MTNIDPTGAAQVPSLPQAEAVATAVSEWASAHPPLAGMLAAGVPTAQALLKWGIYLLKEGRMAEAVPVFRSAVALTPGDSAGWTNYGVALDRAGSPAESAACLERSLALSRHQPDTWILLSLARKKTGDLPGAEAACRVALEQQPSSFVAWQCLGLLREDQRDYAEAIDCFAACIRHGGKSAAVLANLGKLYYASCRIAEAYDLFVDAVQWDPSSQHYRKMLRKSRFMHDILQGGSVEDGLAAFRGSFTPPDSPTEKDLMDLLQTAFGIFSGFGNIEAAKRVGEKQRELFPNSSSVRYLMEAIGPEAAGLNRSPSEYIVEHFDAFAKSFDDQLVRVLGYEIPERIGAMVRAATAAGQRYDAVDAGCGTGLCGPWLRPLAATLTGVDLSPKMLEQAAKRNVYDQLVCEDLTTFLDRSPGRFDLMVAADVVIYFGDLGPWLAGAAGALRPGGLLVFSIERWSGAGFKLLPSGRFSHAPDYVRSIAAAGFVEQECIATTIRLEVNARLPGNIFVFKRR